MKPPPLPKLVKTTSSRRIVLIVLSIVLGVILLTGGGLYALLYYLTTDPIEANFPRVKVGMTEEKAIKILGQPYLKQPEKDGTQTDVWNLHEWSGTVALKIKDGSVIRKYGFGQVDPPEDKPPAQ